MDDTERVTLFKSAKEAATAVLGGAGAAINVAAAAKDVWKDPSFQTMTLFVETARKNTGDVVGGVAGIDKMRMVARQMSGTFEVAGAVTKLPSVPTVLTESLGGVASAAGSAASMVPGLALGVGLLNLGVGVYNTVQIHRLGAQVGAMHADLTAGFDRIDTALAWQRHQIVLLAVGQASIASRLEQLRKEMNDGFDRVVAAVQGAEERRLADEYQERVELVATRYRRLEEDRVEGASPRQTDINRLIEAGEALLAWLKPQLGRHEPGSPARLPFLVAKALATRACVEARAAEGDGRTAPDRDISRMFAEISKEVFALCDGRSLHWIGVEAAAIITQYVYLARGLLLGQLFAGEGDATQLPVLGGEWNDGLGALRGLASLPSVGESAWLPLSTIDDLRWYIAWKQADERTTDLRDVRAVDVLAVSRGVGMSERPRSLGPAQLEVLLAASLPAFRDQALVRLMMAFDWTRPPAIEEAVVEEPRSSPAPMLDVPSTGTYTNAEQWAKVRLGRMSVSLSSRSTTLPVTSDGTRSIEILRVGSRCVVGSPDGSSPVQRGSRWARWALLGVDGRALIKDGLATEALQIVQIRTRSPSAEDSIEAAKRIMTPFGDWPGDRRVESFDVAVSAGLPAGVPRKAVRWCISWAAASVGSGRHDSGVAITGSEFMLWTGWGSPSTYRAFSWPFTAEKTPCKVVIHWAERALLLDSVYLYRASKSDWDCDYFECLSAALGALGLISHEVGA